MALAPHGYLNVECLLVGIIGLFLPRILTFLLLIAETGAAFIYLVCYTYQFSLSNLIASSHSLAVLPGEEILLILGAAATVMAFSALAAFGPPQPRGRSRVVVSAILLSAALVSVTIDTLDGQNPALPRDSSHAMARISISPVVELGKRGMLFRSVKVSARQSKGVSMPSASSAGIQLVGGASSANSPNVVLVVLESWGAFRDPNLAAELTAGYQGSALDSNYRVSFGTVPFEGLTVPGEARELCHSEIGFGILDLPPAQARGCLPAIFHSRGYQDVAVHGYTGGMFERERWYKSLGFDERWFGPDFERLGLAKCKGAFPGICDGDIADWIGHSLLADTTEHPRFVYWVTLNSHLPVNAGANPPIDPKVCAIHAELQNSAPLCTWFRLVLHVHRSVQRLALENRNRPTVFIVVGDHTPPFASPHLRELFSSTEVPYAILTPRDRASNDDAMSYGGA